MGHTFTLLSIKKSLRTKISPPTRTGIQTIIEAHWDINFILQYYNMNIYLIYLGTINVGLFTNGSICSILCLN